MRFGRRVLAFAVVGGLASAASGPAAAIAPATTTAAATSSADLAPHLDPTFGTGGIAEHDLGLGTDYATAVAKGNDGTVVTAGIATAGSSPRGRLALARYLADGRPDVTFGTNGALVTEILPDKGVSASAVRVDSQGRIVAGGSVSEDQFSLHPYVARATADGALDPLFGTNGVVMPTVSGNEFRDVLVSPDDNVYALTSGFDTTLNAGTVTVLRLRGDTGVPDDAYGDHGRAVIACSGGCRGDRMAFTPDGGLAVVGGIFDSFSVVKITAAGTVDLLFGDQGVVHGDDLLGRDIAVTSAGEVVVAGVGKTGDLAVVRLLSIGARDITFGASSLATFATAGLDGAWAIDVDLSRRVVLAVQNGDNRQAEVVRLTSSGALDESFGGTGRVLLPAGSADATAIALDGAQPLIAGTLLTWPTGSFVAKLAEDGALVWHRLAYLGRGATDRGEAVAALLDGGALVATWQWQGSESELTVSRVSASGALDPFFGTSGIVRIERGSVWGGLAVGGLVIQPDGRAVLAFTHDGASGREIVLARLLSDGSLDPSFGNGGKVTVGSTDSGGVADVLAQEDGRLVVLATRMVGSDSDVVLARRLPDGSPDASFGGGGELVFDGGLHTYDDAVDLAEGSSGTLVVSSLAQEGDAGHGQIRRFLSNGAIDPGFGTAGKVQDRTAGLLLGAQPDGRIVTAGPAYPQLLHGTSASNRVRFNRLTAAGALDPSFGNAGGTDAVFGETNIVHPRRLVMAGGRPTVFGDAFMPVGTTLAVARVTADGQLDPSMGGDGTATYSDPSRSFQTRSAVLDSAGRVLLTGEVIDGTPTRAHTFVARMIQRSDPVVLDAGRYAPLDPVRLLNTRNGVGAPIAPIGAGQSFDLPVTGVGGVPASGVSAVVLNVTATQPTGYSWLTSYPTGGTVPNTAALTYGPGQTVSNLVIAKVGTGGKTSLRNASGSVHLIVEVLGWYSS